MAVGVSLVLSALEVASEDLLSISVADLSADETDVVVDFSVLVVEDMAWFLETLSVCQLITNTQRRTSTFGYQYVTFT